MNTLNEYQGLLQSYWDALDALDAIVEAHENDDRPDVGADASLIEIPRSEALRSNRQGLRRGLRGSDPRQGTRRRLPVGIRNAKPVATDRVDLGRQSGARRSGFRAVQLRSASPSTLSALRIR